MKKLIVVPVLALVMTACGSNANPYDISDETLDKVQTRVAESFLPKSIIDDYKKEDIIITNICKAEHPLGNENVDYIYQYKTDDDEYESEIGIFKTDDKVKRLGQYEIVEGTCESVNYQ
ncbi:hypothetical protein GCM10022378_00080 [Salinicoccus jeotgali]|uniref:Uncharacterized protein n=1 Tax=Salinicoccus jeotgali TaxID=381634 RepID=A0ABP7E265_9STAP